MSDEKQKIRLGNPPPGQQHVIEKQADGSWEIRVESEPSNCFIATAAYGSPLASEVQFLREIRDNILRRTRWGKQFFDTYWRSYYRISPDIATQMRNDSELLQVIRWSIVTPWVNYMKLLDARPDWNLIDLSKLDPELRQFLIRMQQDMADWLKAIELPKSFADYTPLEAVQELNVILDFIRPSAGLEYLNELVTLDALPLQYDDLEEAVLLDGLHQADRSDEEIARILYKPK